MASDKMNEKVLLIEIATSPQRFSFLSSTTLFASILILHGAVWVCFEQRQRGDSCNFHQAYMKTGDVHSVGSAASLTIRAGCGKNSGVLGIWKNQKYSKPCAQIIPFWIF
jgi:hypothetical protein